MLLTNDSMYKALLAKTAKDSWESLYKLKVLGEVCHRFDECANAVTDCCNKGYREVYYKVP